MSGPAAGPIAIEALYHFARWPDFARLREPLAALCENFEARGSLLVASEGINGTVSAPAARMDGLLAAIEALTGFSPLMSRRRSFFHRHPFARMKVRLKREIVTLGAPADPLAGVGRYVEPEDWNALISAPDTILIDTRNDYEIRIGAFAGARDPGTASFSQFPDYCERELADDKDRPIAMYCTGGVRCEKATAFLQARGFTNLFHLRGGILRYLEEIAPQDSLWEGACFVFDERVALGHELRSLAFEICAACGGPRPARASENAPFAPCPHCGAANRAA